MCPDEGMLSSDRSAPTSTVKLYLNTTSGEGSTVCPNMMCESSSIEGISANAIRVKACGRITMNCMVVVEKSEDIVPFDEVRAHFAPTTFGTLREAIVASEEMEMDDGRNIVIDIITEIPARAKLEIISNVKLNKNNRMIIQEPK
ncbi:hypothetical protein QAD02_018005 [Eretmocerus hayati]|uniref:Uncharacterized protein n=1 Tax=Eretmocerus hayati TaxID=131215 RepID=A0ACC2PGN7_9HYME|nr:hypothetical protein QAD02_018005 [Eretmocerus hayati]